MDGDEHWEGTATYGRVIARDVEFMASSVLRGNVEDVLFIRDSFHTYRLREALMGAAVEAGNHIKSTKNAFLDRIDCLLYTSDAADE